MVVVGECLGLLRYNMCVVAVWQFEAVHFCLPSVGALLSIYVRLISGESFG